ncbi:MAG: 2OG-Fe(II) oxygenase [Methylobacteriaceae bacterium]|nr:2OG-Fe(II) oxygenase [Methylobacteriaceae bacterium]
MAAHVRAAIRHARVIAAPWLHWQIADVLPADVLRALAGLPISPAIADGPSGRREYRNERRIYFDRANMAQFPLMREVAEAFQSAAVTKAVSDTFCVAIDQTFLRIEYALDTDGFWLEPHTDIGVKKFTCFLYLDGLGDLGTDIYADAQTFAYRVPFAPNSALAFLPSENTWHGFAPRPIGGVRRSLIINYVGAEWHAREQLAFPDMPVGAAR